MNLSTAYLEWREATLEEGLQQGQRQVVENLLKARFGELDDEIAARVPEIIKLPVEEYAPLLVQLSRQALLERFPVEEGDG
jgi:hypothetical protein